MQISYSGLICFDGEVKIKLTPLLDMQVLQDSPFMAYLYAVLEIKLHLISAAVWRSLKTCLCCAPSKC